MAGGIFGTGVQRPTLQELLSIIQERNRDNINPNLNQSESTVEGLLNNVEVLTQDRYWGLLQYFWGFFSPSNATDEQLPVIYKNVTGLDPLPDRQSTVKVRVIATPLHVILSGTICIDPDGNNWEFPSDFTVTSGDETVTIISEESEAVQVNAGEVFELDTPDLDVDSITSILPSILGGDAQTLQDLRLIIANNNAAFSRACNIYETVEHQISQLPDVSLVRVLANSSDVFSDGLPSKNYAVYIHGLPDEDAVSEILWNNTMHESFGANHFVEWPDDNDICRDVRWADMEMVYVEIEIHVTNYKTACCKLIDIDALKLQVIDCLNQLIGVCPGGFNLGEPVTRAPIFACAALLQSGLDISEVLIAPRRRIVACDGHALDYTVKNPFTGQDVVWATNLICPDGFQSDICWRNPEAETFCLNPNEIPVFDDEHINIIDDGEICV